jgi:hypothetical protein
MHKSKLRCIRMWKVWLHNDHDILLEVSIGALENIILVGKKSSHSLTHKFTINTLKMKINDSHR